MQLLQDLPDLYYNQALELAQSGSLPLARDKLLATLTLAPDMVDAHVLLGKVYAQLSQYQPAIACWETALKLSPDHIAAQAGMAKARALLTQRARSQMGWRCLGVGLGMALLVSGVVFLQMDRREHAAFQTQMVALEQHAAAVQAEAQQSQQALAVTRQQLTEAQDSQQQVAQQVLALTVERDERQQSLERLHGERETLLTSQAALEQELQGKAHELAAVHSRVAMLMADHAAQTAALQQGEQQRQELTARLHELLAARTALQQELALQAQTFEAMLTAREQDLVQLRQALAQGQQQVQEQQGQAEALQRELGQTVTEREQARAQAVEIHTHRVLLEAQLAATTDQVRELTQEAHSLRARLRTEELHQLTMLPTTAARGITFGQRRTELSEDAQKLLDRASSILHNYPDVHLVIEGYTDKQGKADFNRWLSQLRADAVRAYLIQRGIAPERLMAVGRGAENPVASEDSAAGRMLNRRIEFRLLQRAAAEEETPPTAVE
jgi:outer membrane protein OmpA-like peptidoglycan-associated protein